MSEPRPPPFGELLPEASQLLRRYWLALTLPLVVTLVAQRLCDLSLLAWLRQLVDQNLGPDEKLSADLWLTHGEVFGSAILIMLPLALIALVITLTIGWGATAQGLTDIFAKREPSAENSLSKAVRQFGATTTSLSFLSLPTLAAGLIFALGLGLSQASWILGVVGGIAGALLSTILFFWGFGFLQLYFPLTVMGLSGRPAWNEALRFARANRSSLFVLAFLVLGISFAGSIIEAIMNALLPSEPGPDYSALLDGHMSAREFFAAALGQESPALLVIRTSLSALVSSLVQAFNAIYVTLWYRARLARS